MYVAVLLTQKCTAKCSHCCVSSSPERDEAADVDLVVGALDSLAAVTSFQSLHLVGGEPTLAQKPLLRMLNWARARKIDAQIVTNGSFAVNEKKAESLLSELHVAGLSSLYISFDDYHAPFIPFDRIRAAWRAAKQVPFKSVVLVMAESPKAVINADWVRDHLGEDIPEVDPMSCVTRQRGERFFGISRVATQRIGRGARLVSADEAQPYIDGREVIKLRCPSILAEPTISATNRLWACGGTDLDGNPFLDFGSIACTPAADLYTRGARRPVALAIALYGPGFLVKWLEIVAGLPARDDYAGICEICQDVTTLPAYRDALFRHEEQLWPLIRRRLQQNAQRFGGASTGAPPGEGKGNCPT
jgi:organic radical activating enzyme